MNVDALNENKKTHQQNDNKSGLVIYNFFRICTTTVNHMYNTDIKHQLDR